MDAEKRIVTSRGSAPESGGLRLSIKGLSRASCGSARSRLQLIFAMLEVIALLARSRDALESVAASLGRTGNRNLHRAHSLLSQSMPPLPAPSSERG
jgi:hypothetical protein